MFSVAVRYRKVRSVLRAMFCHQSNTLIHCHQKKSEFYWFVFETKTAKLTNTPRNLFMIWLTETGTKKKKGGEKHIDTENGIIDRVRMKIENKKMKKKSNQRLYTTKFLYDMKRTEQRFWNENKCTHEPVTHTDKIFASVHTAGCCALFFLCLFYYLNRCMLQRDGAENENELNTNNNYTSTEWNNCNLISCLFAVCVWNSAIKHM